MMQRASLLLLELTVSLIGWIETEKLLENMLCGSAAIVAIKFACGKAVQLNRALTIFNERAGSTTCLVD